MDWTDTFRLVFGAGLLYFLYSVGLPLPSLVFFGILFVLLLFLRGAFYRKIDAFLAQRFRFMSGLPSWGRQLVVIVVFIFLYLLLKQVLFEVLKALGVDFQQELLDSLNESVRK